MMVKLVFVDCRPLFIRKHTSLHQLKS